MRKVGLMLIATATILTLPLMSFSEILVLEGKVKAKGRVFVNRILRVPKRSLTAQLPAFITNHSLVFNIWKETYPFIRLRPKAQTIKNNGGLMTAKWKGNIRRGMLLISYSADVESELNLEKPLTSSSTPQTESETSLGVKTITDEVLKNLSGDMSKILAMVMWIKNNIKLTEDGETAPSKILGRRQATEEGIINLLAEMGEAAGFKTRIVNGATASEIHLPLPDGKSFMLVPSGKPIYWVEFLTSNGWIPVDPINSIVFFVPPSFVPLGYADSTSKFWKYDSDKITTRANSATFEIRKNEGKIKIHQTLDILPQDLIFIPSSISISSNDINQIVKKAYAFGTVRKNILWKKFRTKSKYAYNINYKDEIRQKIIIPEDITLKKIYLFVQKLGIGRGNYKIELRKDDNGKAGKLVASSKRNASSLGLSYAPVKFGFWFGNKEIKAGSYWLIIKNLSPAVLSVKCKLGNYLGTLADTKLVKKGKLKGILNLDLEYEIVTAEQKR